jgi:hypothetical protein
MGVKLGLSLREERRPRVYEKKALRRIFRPENDKGTGERRKLHNEELHNVTLPQV